MKIGVRKIPRQETITVYDIVHLCKCDECGKEFEVPPDSVKAFHYCSYECVMEASNRADRERNKRFIEQRRERNKKKRADRPDNVCQHCEKSFRPERSNAKYCSDACRQAAYRERKK
jgi:hypothetical protein